MGNTTRPAENSKKLPRGKPFQPGQSGNKGGRPRKTEEERTLEQMCRDKSLAALDVLMNSCQCAEVMRARLPSFRPKSGRPS